DGPMSMVNDSQPTTIAPFDKIAPVYNRDFSETSLGRSLRAATWDYLRKAFSPGDRVLDMGCGTGVDACMLARRGTLVTAIDQSQAMLDVTGRLAELEGVADSVLTRKIDMSDWSAEDLADVSPELLDRAFDGAYSNFGALNCVENLDQVSAILASIMRTGSRAVFVVMGPVCLWEIFWHLLHAKPRAALRRFRVGGLAHAGDGESVQVWYPSPFRLSRSFERDFRRIELSSLGSFLPPTYLADLVDRRPALFKKLAWLEERTRRLPFLPYLSDHYVVVLERK
ncbi:MAG TPA: methyltransferase domain-containing protein, partial [Anaerolineales bacterium]|nr:methyltransferase domain-containing protein [Anaerolineales bacterium]